MSVRYACKTSRGLLPLILGLLMILGTSMSWGTAMPASAADGGTDAASQTASESRKVVRVGYYEDNNGFQMGFTDEARKSGYAYEYYQEIAKYTGWEYEYVYGSWSELYEKLLSGDIDIMAGVSKTDERMDKMLYPDNVMGTESYYVFVPVNETDIKSGDASTLNGKSIGVNDNSLMLTLFTQFVEDNDLDCQIKTYDGYSSCAAALQSGQIDGYVITDNYVVDGVKPILKIGASDIYFAIANDRPDLLADINDAQNQILAASPYYATYLQAKYFDHSVLRQALTDQEVSWLKEKGTLQVGYIDDQLPYCGTDDTGECTGVMLELKDSIASYLGATVETTAYAGSDELLAALKAGKIDAAFPIYDDTWAAEQEGVSLTREVVNSRMVAIYTGEYAPALLENTAVATQGISQQPYLTQYYPDSQVVDFPDLAACVKALKDGKVKSIVLDNNLAQRYLSENEQDANLHIAYLDSPASFCMAISPTETTLQSVLNKAIANIDSSSITDAIASSTYETANYSFDSFLRHNVLLVVLLLVAMLLIITGVFFVYRRKSEANKRQLMEANRAKSEFLSRMSHDIRTPMNAIVNLTDLARKELDDRPQLERDLGKIAISSEFLLGLINDILDMARVESNKLILTPDVYRFTEFESYLDGVIRPLCQQKKITFTYRRSDIRKDIVVDRTRFNQIFFNILSNAVKYTNPGGEIRFTMDYALTGPDEATGTYTISDNGCGMSEEFLQRIYQPFERADNTEAYSGTGLGLSITKAIVETMNGTIDVKSELGKGTTVTVHLPLRLATEEQSKHHVAMDEHAEAKEAGDYPALEGARILIAEDNELNLEIVRRLLEAEGAQADSAVNGALCVEAFSKSPEGFYAAILMDVRMPVMDGLQAAAKIRALPREDARNVPIIALTANALTDDAEVSREAGMSAHLTKPINPGILYETLSEFVAKGADAAE